MKAMVVVTRMMTTILYMYSGATNGDIDDDDNHVYVQRCRPCCARYVLDRTLLVPVDRTLIIIFLNSSSSSFYHYLYEKLLRYFFGCIVADQIFWIEHVQKSEENFEVEFGNCVWNLNRRLNDICALLCCKCCSKLRRKNKLKKKRFTKPNQFSDFSYILLYAELRRKSVGPIDKPPWPNLSSNWISMSMLMSMSATMSTSMSDLPIGWLG